MILGAFADPVGHLADVGDESLAFLAVEMLGDGVHVVGAVGHQSLAPASHVARGDLVDVGIDLAHDVDHPVLFELVVLAFHVAELPGPPHLIADAPLLHVPRFRVAVGGTQFSHWSVGGAVDILELGGAGIGVAEAGVHRDDRFGVDGPAEADELVHAEVVVFDARPGGVLAWRAAVAFADPVTPVVTAHEISAGPAVGGGVEFLEERQGVGPHAVDVVGGHEGKAADRHGAGIVEGKGQRGVIAVGARTQLEIDPVEFAVGLGSEPCLGQLLVGLGVHERDACRSVEGFQHLEACVADVFPALAHPDAGLRDASEGRLIVAAQHRSLVAGEEVAGIARHGGRDALAEGLPRRASGIHRTIELPVIQQLRPDAAVDATPEVLDELGVNQLGDWLAAGGEVDLDVCRLDLPAAVRHVLGRGIGDGGGGEGEGGEEEGEEWFHENDWPSIERSWIRGLSAGCRAARGHHR